MSCGGSTKKMATGGTTKKFNKGGTTLSGSAMPKQPGQFYGIPQSGMTGPNKNSVTETMKKGGSVKHPGFKAVASKIASKQGVSKNAASAILAASTRKASVKAKIANPRLKRVK
jgi:hypothetical protein